ncbi:3-oxoacyl-[acyl-carrier-protein] reductase FabG [Caulifigura coniformis]|uniref:3-oxoacyl-[acyl-carrier-protein] reductase FabG n=1 Tax=Caulifigura coniformis TaxID=2527983 RepID=A0A517S9B0_9PLAN|nr:3-ketoacyl-ACP reductase [Caulifigura coniformis]QDT52714.1 3-oxoacyl-[acyl-carrier-protein] reductase FabG [Caulifigura coniformis]
MPASPRPVALITGSTRGIGLGIARRLASDGYDIGLNGVRPEADAQEAIREITSQGAAVAYARGDVSSAADRTSMLEAVRSRFGRLDVLINNAGITSPGRKDILNEADEESFDRVMGVNLKGPFFLTQAAARWMVEQRQADQGFQGCIINVSSVSAEFVSTNRGDYCLSKAATRMATWLWATRMAEFGIPVYEIQPGVIRSDMTSGVTEKYDRLIAGGLTLDRRWGEPDDVGRAVAALVRGDIPYATGQVLKIDGGMTIRTL